jgi:hypothetical protein
MDRESQELRAQHSQSWPPGLFVSSLAFDADARSRRRRDGMTMVCLAVCAWSFGYGLTNWFCDSSERTLAVDASQAELRAMASHRQPDAHELANGAQTGRALEDANDLDSEASQHVVAAALPESKRASAPKPRARVAQPKPAAVLAEPTPRVTPEEAERELAMAAVSKRVHASVDESRALSMPLGPQPSTQPVPQQLDELPTRTRAAGQLSEPPFAHASNEPQPSVRPAASELPEQALGQREEPHVQSSAGHPSELPSRARVASESREQRALPLAAADVGKVVAIEALHVEGGLPSTVVSRGVQRLLPHYDRCSQLCDKGLQRLKLSTQIDEAGRGRHVTVEGLSQPSLRRCLEEATAHLVVRAPDTGTARARWIVRFAQR